MVVVAMAKMLSAAVDSLKALLEWTIVRR